MLYGYASSSVTVGAPKYWLALCARREVTDAAWSGLASRIWYVGHPRAITGGCVGGSLLEWSLELYMHQTPLPKGLRLVVLLFWMPVLMASTFGKGHIRPPSCNWIIIGCCIVYVQRSHDRLKSPAVGSPVPWQMTSVRDLHLPCAP